MNKTGFLALILSVAMASSMAVGIRADASSFARRAAADTSAGQAPAPVAQAAQARDAAAVKDLLKKGADVNASQGDGMTALHWAALNGDAEVAQMLLYAGANVGAKTRLGGYTPLHLAAQVGHASVIAPLIAAGAQVSAATATGATALM
ncbi:MAG TPA: ankyrin repeat domain-containing protein, partial [Vicinamibacterales bacterium]|nr:ankyrin repeat domain-containing protein [Vicinamibacterales bacterium]